MTLKIADRARVSPFIVMDMMRAAAERSAAGGDVLHLEAGQPSTGLPAPVAERLRARLAGGEALGYTLALGLKSLRERIARYYADAYRTTVDPDRVVVTTGSSAGFVLGFLTAFAPGDRVGIAVPGYPAYRNILTALGIETVPIPVGADTRYQPTVAILDALGTTLDGLIVASPANPTGTIVPPEEFRALCAWCDRRGVRLVSDEIYHGISFGHETPTAAALSDNAIVVNSFSKYFSMTGWRLGWLVVPRDFLRPIECLAQNLYISAPTLSQHAGEAVFDCTRELDRHVARYAANRALLLDELPGAGFPRLAPPDGAFYLYADVSHRTNDSPEFCRRMLAETGVASTPGVDFDPVDGHRFVRFSFAGATQEVAEAIRRLRAWQG